MGFGWDFYAAGIWMLSLMLRLPWIVSYILVTKGESSQFEVHVSWGSDSHLSLYHRHMASQNEVSHSDDSHGNSQGGKQVIVETCSCVWDISAQNSTIFWLLKTHDYFKHYNYTSNILIMDVHIHLQFV